MDFEKIKDLFFLIGGENLEEMDEERFSLCTELCEAASDAVKAKIKPGANITEHAKTLEYAAAYSALSTLLTIDEALMPESISSGEVKLEMGEKVVKIKALYAEKMTEAAAVLKSDFFFSCMNTAIDEGASI